MNRRTNRVQKLVRLNEFRQDRASASLREAIAEQVRAKQSHADAVEDVDRVGALKPQVLLDGGVDMGRYEVILAMERAALAAAETAAERLAEGEQRRDTAKDGLVRAATATRVARHRGRRTLAAEQVAEEKRTFDRLADLCSRFPGGKR